MEKHEKCGDESSSSTSCSISESQRSTKAKMIHEGMEKDFCWIKHCEGIPLFEAMLTLEQRRTLYSGTEIPKARKGLGYWYQVMMVTIASPKNIFGPSEKDNEGIRTAESDETVELTQAPLALEEGGQTMPNELLEINLGTVEELQPIFISGSMFPKEKDLYLEFVKQNRDVFAWTYSKMSGLDPAIAMYRLAIKPDRHP